MSPDILAALAISMAPTLAIIVTNIFSMAASRKTSKEATKQLQQVANTTEQTHIIVNNQRTEMMKQIDSLKAEVVELKAIIKRS